MVLSALGTTLVSPRAALSVGEVYELYQVLGVLQYLSSSECDKHYTGGSCNKTESVAEWFMLRGGSSGDCGWALRHEN